MTRGDIFMVDFGIPILQKLETAIDYVLKD